MGPPPLIYHGSGLGCPDCTPGKAKVKLPTHLSEYSFIDEIIEHKEKNDKYDKMLKMGVFGGSYFGNKTKEYPKSWFKNAKLSKTFDVEKNRFKLKACL